MRNSTSSLLKGILASGACAAITLTGTLPATARGHEHTRTSAPAHSSAPARPAHYAAPAHVSHYAAPARIPHYAAPARVPHYAAPARVPHYAAPARVTHYAAPTRVPHYAAPVRRERAVAPAPFVQRVAPKRTYRTRATTTAPFVQYVRSAPALRRETVTRTIAASPLVRSVYAGRTRVIPVVYHPRYIAGRVTSVRSNEVIVDPPAGSPIVVRDVAVGAPVAPVGAYVTLPVTYDNGYYSYAQPAYSSYDPNYDYGYAPQYQYAYAPPMYCSGNSSSALYAALLPAVVGMLTGNGSGFNSSDLTSIAAQAALGGGNGCVAEPAASGYDYATPVSYAQPVPVSYAVTQAEPYYTPASYTTPYDTCLAGDEDGDEQCAQSTAYSYGSYSPYGAYTPQQVQGVVIGRSGDNLMVLGAGGTPTFVYAAPALQSGYTVNGPIQPGQIIDAYGYYSGSTFIATALV